VRRARAALGTGEARSLLDECGTFHLLVISGLHVPVIARVLLLLARRLWVRLSDVYRFDARVAYLLPPLMLLGVSWGVMSRRD